MRFDLHIHSRHSFDSVSRVEDIFKKARSMGLDGIAITDHDCFDGSLEAMAFNPSDLVVIPGAEYNTDEGHVLTYFLKEGLEDRKLSRDSLGRFRWQDIVGGAHDQGALVFVAHPFKPLRDHSPELWEAVDGVEIYNSRASLCKNTGANGQALQIARLEQKAFSAGSDAHWLSEIGGAFWQCEPELSVSSRNNSGCMFELLKNALLEGQGRVWGSAASRCWEPASQILKCWLNHDNYPKLPRLLANMVYSSALEGWRKLGLGYQPLEGWMETGLSQDSKPNVME